ncbi:MAG: AMP-binding protein, partial [Acidobacteria bacterium]|nr:AMP-binding protein [Acidobacteriota bacterium]
PLDNALPESRIKNMIDDAQVSVVLSSRKFIRILNRLQWECKSFNTFLCLDSSAIYLEEEAEKSGLMDENLWDYVANSAVDEITGGGWFNSYTGEAFTRLEMDEYRDNISKKLTPLLQEKMKVLEIGCGSGISMYRIAPKTGIYHATDLSREIIEINRKKALAEGHTNILLSHLAAHEIDQLQENKFDLVIINSVIQSFHGFNYLRNVIIKAIDMIGDKGYLFLGDILDLELKQSIIKEMIEFKYHDPRANSKTKTDWSADLFVPRSFFEDLHVDIPTIEKVEFSDKIHTVENELTRFRYDALITVNKHKTDKVPIKSKQKYQDDWQTLGKFSTGKIPVTIHPSNPAYVIYTSGSTGKPKGVVVEHRNVIRLVKNSNYIRRMDFTAKDRFMLTGAFAFDISTFEIWGMLLNGLGISLVDKNVLLDIEKLNTIISKEQISIIHFTPQLLQEIVLHCPGIFEGIRCLLVGGDIVTPTIINRLRNNYKHLEILHMYGPTENTTFSTFFPIDKEYDTNIPIGKPISNSSIYILNSHGGLQPIGVPGELCTGGDGIARGYLNSPELTCEKFDQDLWDVFDDQDEKNKSFFGGLRGAAFSKKAPLVYRTGDLARWLPVVPPAGGASGGVIEFLGRIDNQVKIRGFRIELGEIETRLMNYPGIKEAIVLALGEEDKYLCAYLVAEDEKEITQLREVLARELPDYMVPSYFIVLDKIPLNPNGKVDRKSLPKPGIKAGDSYMAPRDEIEKKLAGIWAEILGRDGNHSSELQTLISIDDNFFQVGGHSLKATVLANRIKKELNVSIPLAEIFKNSTIRGQANYISRCLCTGIDGIETLISPDEHLVKLKVGSTGSRNLFLFHVGTGEVDCYIELCKNIAENYNCWGLRADRLENLAPPDITIPGLAKNYIAIMKKVQPQGPYLLGGWCLGGVIAYEIAAQLEQAGEILTMLLLLDSPFPTGKVSIDNNDQKFNLQTEIEYIKDFVDDAFTEKLKNSTGITFQQFWPFVVDYLKTNHFDVENIKKIITEYSRAALPNYEHLGLEEAIYVIPRLEK